MQLDDIYIAIEQTQREESIKLFIEKYLVGFESRSEYYEYPMCFHGDIEFETASFQEMIHYILSKPKRSFDFHFGNPKNREFPRAMIFVNKDGSVLLGLGLYGNFLEKYKKLLSKDFNSTLILVCNEVLPPNSIEDIRLLLDSQSPLN